eukprot:CAMPEP_0206005522 /NCGR_PEP_ID=MMETSP1464-20131121/4626_1 /ASSEMBLY_ACC=CAM_ASM_001124 /TAXON_ID=119497 /ORGANISM="Exanthemachrysis gayraliae, Strain RCC1523" /LENGTH=207 /DNA_ID=CAMNT_0053378959 /DNA_START=82 /DNA_END=703 /DNA_ORIENTATION=+
MTTSPDAKACSPPGLVPDVRKAPRPAESDRLISDQRSQTRRALWRSGGREHRDAGHDAGDAHPEEGHHEGHAHVEHEDDEEHDEPPGQARLLPRRLHARAERRCERGGHRETHGAEDVAHRGVVATVHDEELRRELREGQGPQGQARREEGLHGRVGPPEGHPGYSNQEGGIDVGHEAVREDHGAAKFGDALAVELVAIQDAPEQRL